jgi:uncharacterized protein YuzE
MMANYFAERDSVYVQLRNAAVVATRALGPYRMVDVDGDGQVVGIEFLGASREIDLTGLPERERIAAAVEELKRPFRLIA